MGAHANHTTVLKNKINNTMITSTEKQTVTGILTQIGSLIVSVN